MKTYRVTRGVLTLPSSVSSENRRPKAGETFTSESRCRFIRRSLENGDIAEVTAVLAVEKGQKQ